MNHYHSRDFYAELLKEDEQRLTRLKNLGIILWVGAFGYLGYQIFDLASRWHFTTWLSTVIAKLD